MGNVPMYSGERRSGICKCGHRWDDHHLGMVMNEEYRSSTREACVPQECEFYGCNKDGGMDDEGNPHCFQYVDVLDNSCQLVVESENPDRSVAKTLVSWERRKMNKHLTYVLALEVGDWVDPGWLQIHIENSLNDLIGIVSKTVLFKKDVDE